MEIALDSFLKRRTSSSVIQEFLFQYLNCDGIAGLGIGAAVDVGHAAHTDQTFDLIPSVQPFSNEIIHD